MKIKNISIMNVILCLSVVMIHLTSNLVINLNKESIWYLAFFLVNKILTFAVPAFLFLSGYKLYNRYKDEKIDCKKFYAGRIKKVLIPYVFAYVIYFLYFYYLGWIDTSEFIKQLLLGTLAAHFYYIIISVQFYGLFPLIKYIFNKYDIITVCASLLTTLVFNQWLNFEYIDRFFCTYIFYFILGMFLAKRFSNTELHKKKLIYLSYGLITPIHIALCYEMSLGNLYYKYAGIGQVLFSIVSILVLYDLSKYFAKANWKIANKVVEYLEPCTYNIYLYHVLLINIIRYSILPYFTNSLSLDFIVNSIAMTIVITIYAIINNYCNKKRYARTGDYT